MSEGMSKTQGEAMTKFLEDICQWAQGYIDKHGDSFTSINIVTYEGQTIAELVMPKWQLITKAIAVFGSEEEAKRWLDRPAIGLDQQRPIDLMTTSTGIDTVMDYLTRIEHGVYT